MEDTEPPELAMWAFGYCGFIMLIFIVLYLIDKAGWHYALWQFSDWGITLFGSLFANFGYYILMRWYIKAWCIRWKGKQTRRQDEAKTASDNLNKDHSKIVEEAQKVEELKKERKLREEADIKIFVLEKKVKELEQQPLIIPIPIPTNVPQAEGSPVIHPITMEAKTDAKPIE